MQASSAFVVNRTFGPYWERYKEPLNPCCIS